jgi:enamine deaminase RidA (YjgF/YER057c/UK114 family)
MPLVVERGGMVYVKSLPPEPQGGMREQTRRALERLDGLLALAGTSKSRLLTAQVRLADMALRDEHEAAWSAWVADTAHPLRAFSKADLQPPGTLVEIMVTATK